jgi:flagellar L-ring protein precursor FlgH
MMLGLKDEILRGALAVLLLAVFIPGIYAENLSGGMNFLYTNRTSYKKGDIIRILVNENASAMQSNETGLSKDVGLSGGGGITNGVGYNGYVNYSNQNNGKGTAKQSGVLQTEVTVEVQDIRDNGNLLIKGHKEVQMNGNTQKITVEGEVNPIDIAADNTVLSTNIFNARIDYTGDGVLGNKSRVGILSQLFEWIGLF